MGSQFSSFLPINVINVAVSAERAMLDNQIGIKLEFLRLPPREAPGKTLKSTVENKSGVRVCRGRISIFRREALRSLCTPCPMRAPEESLPAGVAGRKPQRRLGRKHCYLCMWVLGPGGARIVLENSSSLN